jgi:outer membrane protein assembly factor BamD (BamD/ComL family)
MKYKEWFKCQLMDRDETTPEMKLAKAWSTCAWYHQEKHHQKKDLNKIIQEIKQKTQSLKDKRKNAKYNFKILHGTVIPTCKYGINYLEYLNTLSEFDRMYIEGINLVNQISDLTKEIDRVENVITNYW